MPCCPQEGGASVRPPLAGDQPAPSHNSSQQRKYPGNSPALSLRTRRCDGPQAILGSCPADIRRGNSCEMLRTRCPPRPQQPRSRAPRTAIGRSPFPHPRERLLVPGPPLQPPWGAPGSSSSDPTPSSPQPGNPSPSPGTVPGPGFRTAAVPGGQGPLKGNAPLTPPTK